MKQLADIDGSYFPLFKPLRGIDLHCQPLDLELALFHNRIPLDTIFWRDEFRYTPPWTWSRVRRYDVYGQVQVLAYGGPVPKFDDQKMSRNQLLATNGFACVREWLTKCVKLRKIGKYGYYLIESNALHKGMAGMATGPELLYVLGIDKRQFAELCSCPYVGEGPPIECSRPEHLSWAAGVQKINTPWLGV